MGSLLSVIAVTVTANAPAVLGFDPTPRFVDFILRVATRGTRRAAA